MIKISMIRKYATVVALAISAALYLPEALLAQGAVVGYANGSQTGNVTFNVSNLTNGIYYLHIYGVNEKPIIRQVMIEH